MAKAKPSQPKNDAPAEEAQIEVTMQQDVAEKTHFQTGIDDITADLYGQQPDINPGVILADESDKQQTVQTPAPVVSSGRSTSFNPEIHEVDAAGTPILTPSGRFKRKPGTRKVSAPALNQSVPTSPIDMINMGKATNAATAETLTGLKTALAVAIISKEWELTKEERSLETSLLAASLDKYAPMGAPINPLVLWAGVSAMHAAKRLAQPETQSWVTRTKVRLAAWWMKRKGLKNATQSHSGSDHERENNASDTTA